MHAKLKHAKLEYGRGILKGGSSLWIEIIDRCVAKHKCRSRRGARMKYYTSTTETEFSCGIDLHSREMYMCLVGFSDGFTAPPVRW